MVLLKSKNANQNRKGVAKCLRLGLIVNHGIIDPVTKLRDTNAEDWKKTFDVNFMSAVAFVGPDRNVMSSSLRRSRPRLHCLC